MEGLSLKQVAKAIERIKKYRGIDDSMDFIYVTDFPEDERQLHSLLAKADAVGVTWMLEHVYGLRYTKKQAIERIRKGPPRS